MRLSTYVAATAAVLLTSAAAFADAIAIKDPYVRASTPNAKTGAAFFEIHNTSGADDRLVAARTEVARRVELHTHTEDANGVMRMGEIEGGIPVADGASHHLKRGGDHVMLMGLTGPLEQDETITLILTFETAGEITVEVPVDHKRKASHGH